ncbi:hypothetical protein QJS66_12505 [Kocuria rhizophila]|nr:hypothetical protein QJS66_12505 [Kocuria rhizophila]
MPANRADRPTVGRAEPGRRAGGGPRRPPAATVSVVVRRRPPASLDISQHRRRGERESTCRDVRLVRWARSPPQPWSLRAGRPGRFRRAGGAETGVGVKAAWTRVDPGGGRVAAQGPAPAAHLRPPRPPARCRGGHARRGLHSQGGRRRRQRPPPPAHDHPG